MTFQGLNEGSMTFQGLKAFSRTFQGLYEPHTLVTSTTDYNNTLHLKTQCTHFWQGRSTSVPIIKLICHERAIHQTMSVYIWPVQELPYFMMTSPSKHSSKFYCLTQGIMVIWRGQNNANSLKIVLKLVINSRKEKWNSFQTSWILFST